MRSSNDATQPETPHAADRAERDPEQRPERLPERYRLLEVIGAGGMGRVYRAEDTMLGRQVAIKVIEGAPTGTGATQPRDRFVREARAAARLAHPNIVAVHDVDPEAGWLVMDLVEGEPLRELASRGPVAPAKVRAIAEQVLSALDAAHASGVIHRDIKPSNIIVDARGKITLVDFGVARLVDAELTRTGESLGTPAYMAPEQLRGGAVDARTDLYGLAATLYELVTGERMVAFESPSPESVGRVRGICGRERGLAELITRCLQGPAEHRLGSAREAMRVLERRRSIRGRAVAAVAVLVIAGAAAVAAWWWTRPKVDPRELELFTLTQRGEHEKAGVLLEQYVASHADDAEARTMLLLTGWWTTGRLDEPIPGIDKVTPVERDMLHGISLITTRHEKEAIAYLEDAAQHHPDTVELEYALGEARWHGQELERGVATLEHAFTLDPRWQMALHHVVEFRLSRGETSSLRPIATALHAIDAPQADALACQIAIADRKPGDAAKVARAALDRDEPIPALYVCLLQAQILAGDIAAAERTTKEAMERWPIDLREWGGRAIATELLLYRGKLAEYLDASRSGNSSRQRFIALALWQPTADLVENEQNADAIRGQPIVPASQTLIEHQLGRDQTQIYAEAPEPELRAYGRGLAAELHGDPASAAVELRRGLAVAAKGDVRLLVAYQLAHALVAAGDMAGAKAACEEVIAPHQYQGYRAALLPDCVLWSGDRARWRELSATWTGEFQHPAIVEIRRRLLDGH